jgi:FAD/FMN-containing dehydrogenase
LIPRAAGTSLAGQAVGKGIVVDISYYFNQVIELNVRRTAGCVYSPAIIRDDLNAFLKPYGLMFGPENIHR